MVAKVVRLVCIGLLAALVVVAAPIVSLAMLVWDNEEESRELMHRGEVMIASLVLGDVLILLCWRIFPPSNLKGLLHPLTFVLVCGVWTLYNVLGGVFWFFLMNAVEGSTIGTAIVLAVCAFGHVALLTDLCVLSRCTLSGTLYRCLVNFPAACWFTSLLLVIPFIALSGLVSSLASWFPLVPLCGALLVSVVSLFQTIHTPSSAAQWSVRTLDWCDVKEEATVARNGGHKTPPSSSSSSLERRPLGMPLAAGASLPPHKKVLRIVQITDPHLGSFMPVERLHKICQQTVEINPDIVLLTGDFFTAEAYQPHQHALERALEPLQALRGKVIACLGNHDKEKAARQLTTDGLESISARLLVDESMELETDAGPVQIVGLDFRMRARERHVLETIERHPPSETAVLRILLIHDPGAFKFVPQNDLSLTFSGHTHGGQIGLHLGPIHLSLVGVLGVPDQGLWAHGSNRLYVHRGQGCRSFMGSTVLRVGTPPEFQVLEVLVPSAA